MSPLKYPESRRGDASREFHGERVAEPYQWLEDPDSAETAAWVGEQNALTRSVLEACPAREELRERLTASFDYERFSVPFRRGPRYFYRRNSGLQNQAVLYKQDALDAPEEVLLDPNALSEDGTAALGRCAFTEDGALMAYAIARSGSDWQTVYVRDVATGRDLEGEAVEWVKFSGLSWTHDGRGFFYSRYPRPDAVDADDPDFKRGSETQANLNQALYYHRVGTPQSEDALVFASPENPKWMVGAEVTDDGETLLLYISESTDNVNRLFYASLAGFDAGAGAGALEVVRLVDNFEAEYSYVLNEGRTFYFKTSSPEATPRGKVITVHLDTGARADVLPQHETDVLSDVRAANGNRLVACYMHDVKELLRVYSLEGELVVDALPMPAAGTVGGLSARREHTELFYKFVSFLYPGTVYRYDFATGEATVFRETRVPGLDPSQYETRQVFYESKDGTRVPMYVVHRRGLRLDGQNPCLLYGYGGFSISLAPSYSVSRLVFVANMGGVVAVANLRGGGEYGEEWHKAGVGLKKQNVFDDFQAGAEYLVREGYTSSARLAIQGGSNGGLLVGACVNQRPELYACGIAAVGVMDMLTFHKHTIGYAWCSDYGCADASREEFENLRALSPLHNVRAGVPYPAVLLTTADHDDRVVPLHSFKLAAQLQHVAGPSSEAPLLIRVDVNAGHGAGKPLSKTVDELVDVYSFIAQHCGATWRA